ncbi:MAG: 2-polyprenyl-3-methyl-5-hydroxy-6-metoxy-1,4-benzoquinol methylase [Ilumatobacter sp.]|jgi:2-polyprenyl-3-methyl-5-hydroxy-6-metoxy-1,4-benzoquinol methylase
MTTSDAERWDARYDGQPLAEPAPPDAVVAAEFADRIPTIGRALDVACGSGGQSLWLALRGLDVTALDVSPAAIAMTADACDRYDVSDRVEAVVSDLDIGLAEALGGFDVIVCQRFRATHLFEEFVNRLRPGGIAVITVLSETGAADPGPFHAPSGELSTAFDRSDADVLFHAEAQGQESIIITRR